MRIAVVGMGHVGLVTAACFAEMGNVVTCCDGDTEKIERLRDGIVSMTEPGLAQLVLSNAHVGRLNFTTDLGAAIEQTKVIFLALATPSGGDGLADLSCLWTIIEKLSAHLAPDAIVVNASTVPIGTNVAIRDQLRRTMGRECDVVSNPEFLREGAAIDDFMNPDRIIVGARGPEVTAVLKSLYDPLLRTGRPFLSMSPESAEMTKLAANAFVATKISYINEMANLCERIQADVNDVRSGIGFDNRIGFAFLFPGVGYGGSYFPQAVRTLRATAGAHRFDARLLSAVDEVNDLQKTVIFDKLTDHFKRKLAEHAVAVWGLAFKPRTDDIREAPALSLIDDLLKSGARVHVYDPEAMPAVQQIFGNRLLYAESEYEALDGVEALAIMTEWKQFAQPDLEKMRCRMRSPVVFDGRNLDHPAQMAAAGFTYHSIGRRVASPT